MVNIRHLAQKHGVGRMGRKARLLMVATLPLYLGPLLAGLSGLGWSATPVFVALIALWFVVMRPHQWPRKMALWTPQVMTAALFQILVNIVIVVALFGIGRGIGAVAGFSFGLSPLVPVALAFLAIPLSRMVWDPVKAHEMDQFLDGALDQINRVNRGQMAPAADPVKDPILVALLDLPDDADPVLIADAIDAAMRAPGAALRLSRLQDELDMGMSPRAALREGFVLWSTDQGAVGAAGLQGAQLAGFFVAGSDPRLLDLFAARALLILQANPTLWPSFPDEMSLGLVLDESLPADVQMRLRALTDAVVAATPQDAR